MNIRHMLAAGGLALFWLASPITPPAHAEPLYALAQVGGQGTPIGFNLVSFDSATPNLLTTQVRVTGLSLFEGLRDLDFRSANGQLYSLGSNGTIYTLNPTTGAATQVSGNGALGSQRASMDFNPVTDQLRVFTDRGEDDFRNYRVNVDTGAVILDSSSTFAGGLAYTNNYAGATTTTLYALSGVEGFPFNQLSLVDPENTGQFNRVGPLVGITPNSLVTGFDISGLTGTAYAAIASNITPQGSLSQLYTINLSTGAASLVGPIGDGTRPIIGVAAPVGPSTPTVPEPATWVLLSAGLAGVGAVARKRQRRSCR